MKITEIDKHFIRALLKKLLAKPYCFLTGHSYTNDGFNYTCRNCGDRW